MVMVSTLTEAEWQCVILHGEHEQWDTYSAGVDDRTGLIEVYFLQKSGQASAHGFYPKDIVRGYAKCSVSVLIEKTVTARDWGKSTLYTYLVNDRIYIQEIWGM
jgi:hypothetical protein